LFNLIVLASSVASQSSTSISELELFNLVVLASLVNSQSSTAEIPLSVVRDFASVLVSASLTDAIDLSIQVGLASLIESESLTNPKARFLADLVAAIQTEMMLQMAGSAPSTTLIGAVPYITISRT
jgi:hypothetical protein